VSGWWRRFLYAWRNAGHILVDDCLALNAKLAILERERNYAWGQLNKRTEATSSNGVPGITTMLHHRETARLLLERDTETQRADEAERQLHAARARIHGLEETVRAYAGHTCDTAVMPRVRSHPGPGLAIDVTRPGDEDELLMRRPR
jgi:hypothetical protein